MPNTAADSLPPFVHVAVGVVCSDCRVLIAQRPAHKHQGSLWEFPGGKVEPGEAPRDALVRELWEELRITVTAAKPLIKIRHDYGDARVLLDVWQVTGFSGVAEGAEGQKIAWVRQSELSSFPVPEANQMIIRSLALPDLVAITGGFSSLRDFEYRLRRAVVRGAQMIYLRIPEEDALGGDLCRVAQDVCEQLDVRVCSRRHWLPRLGLSAGLHLNSSDLAGIDDRSSFGSRFCGASCHDSNDLAHAVRLKLDYVFLSPLRTTASHPEARPLEAEIVTRWISQHPIPVYGLGGVGPADLESVRNFGARGIAAISAFWD